MTIIQVAIAGMELSSESFPPLLQAVAGSRAYLRRLPGKIYRGIPQHHSMVEGEIFIFWTGDLFMAPFS
jgi:hypothetical protein